MKPHRLATKISAAFIPVLVLAAILAVPAVADHTRFWRQSSYEEFQKGTPKGVVLRSDGNITLAPKVAAVADPNLAYLRALRTDSHGNLYAAGGSNAKVIRVDSNGQQTTVFDSPELTAQALAVDKNDNVYVGTSPDGKVYKVAPGGQKSVFFDPQSKYIWDLLFGPDGTLYIATGDTGKIFSVAPDGKGGVFYSSEETHIRALALDGKGNLIAGTEPDGWVMRIPLAIDPPPGANSRRGGQQAASAAQNAATNSDRKAYVLYETPKREITAIAADPSGNLYVAGIGDKQRTGVTSFIQPAQQQNVQVTATVQGQEQNQAGNGAQAVQQVLSTANLILFPNVTSSAVYRIATDGSPAEIWNAPDDIIYALSFASDGNLLVGVGNRGAVMEVQDDRVFSLLANTDSGQVTGFARAANGKVFVATANPGKVVALGPGLESEGTLESQTYDAQIFSRWGRLNWWGKNGAGSASGVQFYVRSGNTSDPSNNWSDWSGPYANGSETSSPAARFVQWKAVLQQSKGAAPEISWVDIAYLPKNVAPQIDAIAIQNPGVHVNSFGGAQQGGGAAPTSVQVRMPSSSGSQASQGGGARTAERFDAPLQGVFQKGYESVVWSAEDENDDELTYSIYLRGENETNWRLLKEHLDQKFYSWDTSTMPDGAYYLKIVASDEKSNPPQEALEGSRESERFVVDNSPPHLTEVTAEVSGSGAIVHFGATDSASPIVRATYSLDSGDWIPLRPVGDISDALAEQYALTLPNLSAGEHTVSVRVYDQFENEAAAKTTFTVPRSR